MTVSNTGTKKRIEFIDMAKGISILLIIIFHLRLDIMPENAPGDWYLLVFGPFVVTIFFILSGMTFKYVPDFKSFFIKKTKGYLIPYFGLGLFLVLAFWAGGGFSLGALAESVKNLLLQQRFTTLWFLAALYLGIILFWFICFVCKDNINGILVLSLVVSVLSMFLSDKYKTQFIWNADAAGCVQFYLALGYFCKKKELLRKIEELVLSKKIIGCILCFVLEIAFAALNRHLGFSDLQMYYSSYGCIPLTMLATIFGSAATILFSSMFTTRFLSYVGRCSLAFFALHQTVFMEIMYIIYRALNIPYDVAESHAYLYCRPITFAVILIGCSLFDIIVSKTRFKAILGK